jgi:putative spermidine/putrescine transport system permease protein
VFFGFPVLDILRLSLSDFDPPQVSGLDNFEWFFGTNVNVVVLERTLWVSLVVTIVCALLAYPYAYLMTRVSRGWFAFMLMLVLVPFWTSLMVRNYAWLVLLQDSGPINDVLDWLGLGRAQLVDNVVGVVIGEVQILLPFMVIPLYATLRRIDPALVLAAQGLGASPRVAFARVYFPLSAPGVLAGALLTFVLALGFYIAPALLGSPQESLLPQLLAIQVNKLFALGRAGTMAAVLLLSTLVLLAMARWASGRARARVAGAS